MADREDLLDTEIYARMATLFSQKRKVFAPESVEALASDVLRRISGTARRVGSNENPVITDASIDAFCDALIQPEPDAALEFITERRAEGLTRAGVYLGYVCAAARRLGEGWEKDRLSFVDVTTGTGHLYALMRAMRAERGVSRVGLKARRYALFATVPGEDHGIGVTVAADMFRERGWEIDLKVGEDHGQLIAHVERMSPPVIGLSLSTRERFDALVRLVVALRLVAPHAILGVAPSGQIERQEIVDLVDIDLLFDGVVAACADIEALITGKS